MGSGTVAILMVVVLVVNGALFLLWKLMDRTTRSSWLLEGQEGEVRALLPEPPQEEPVALSYAFERLDDLGTRKYMVNITLEGHRFLPEGMQLELALNGDPPLADDGRGHYIDLVTDRAIASFTTGRTLRELQVLFTQAKGVGTKGIRFDPHAPRVTLELVCTSRLFEDAHDDAAHITQFAEAITPFATWLLSWEPAAHTESERWAALYGAAKDHTHLGLILEKLGAGEVYQEFVSTQLLHGTLGTLHAVFIHDPHTFMHTIDPTRCLEFFNTYTPYAAHIPAQEFARRFALRIPLTILSSKKMPLDYRAALLRVWSSNPEIDQALLHHAVEMVPEHEQKRMRALLEDSGQSSRGALSVSDSSTQEGGLSVIEDES